MFQHEKDKRGPTPPPSNDSVLTLEQQRHALAEDIALLVVRQHRRQNASLGDPADVTNATARQND